MTKTDITSRQIPSLRQAGQDPLLRTLARAAKAQQTGECFVFASYAKWNISTEAPTTGRYYHFAADGHRFLVEA